MLRDSMIGTSECSKGIYFVCGLHIDVCDVKGKGHKCF